MRFALPLIAREAVASETPGLTGDVAERDGGSHALEGRRLPEIHGPFGPGSPVPSAGKRYPAVMTLPLSLAECVLVLRPDDDVGVATRDLQSGTEPRLPWW